MVGGGVSASMPELRSTQNRLRDPEVCTRTSGAEAAAQAVGLLRPSRSCRRSEVALASRAYDATLGIGVSNNGPIKTPKDLQERTTGFGGDGRLTLSGHRWHVVCAGCGSKEPAIPVVERERYVEVAGGQQDLPRRHGRRDRGGRLGQLSSPRGAKRSRSTPAPKNSSASGTACPRPGLRIRQIS
jgi:hypothetical protein